MTHNHFDNFCLYAGFGIRAGYPSSRLLASLPSGQRTQLHDVIVLALTANPYYALKGVRPGASLASVAKRVHAGKVIPIGSNDWYIVPDGSVSGVLKVRHGVVQEIGLAAKQLTITRASQRRFLSSFKAG